MCIVHLHFPIPPSRSCTHGSRHIIFAGMRLWKIMIDGHLVYLEPSLGTVIWMVRYRPTNQKLQLLGFNILIGREQRPNRDH